MPQVKSPFIMIPMSQKQYECFSVVIGIMQAIEPVAIIVTRQIDMREARQDFNDLLSDVATKGHGNGWCEDETCDHNTKQQNG